MTPNPIPERYGTVTPYLVVKDAAAVLEFAKKVFDAEWLEVMKSPGGAVVHAEFRIGDSIVMVGSAREPGQVQTAMLYIYLEDVDATYRSAIEAGAVSQMEPANQFYGDRNAGVEAAGVKWWLATHIEDVSPEEIERRQNQQGK